MMMTVPIRYLINQYSDGHDDYHDSLPDSKTYSDIVRPDSVSLEAGEDSENKKENPSLNRKNPGVREAPGAWGGTSEAKLGEGQWGSKH